MRIDELRLIAFGPFTDTVIDLSAGREGFHIIYGPNEAGKSSSLRALKYALYGMPVQLNDDFIHPYAKLRIGAVLRSHNGKVLELVRRKGRENTLRTADDNTLIDEVELKTLLGGVDSEYFSSMFGIDYEDLVTGGKEIIQGGGNLGRVIFSAGTGIANLRDIQSELRQAAERYFKPAGQNPIINKAVAQLNQLRKELRAAQLPGEEWVRHDTSLQDAIARKKTVEKQLTKHNKEQSRLMRIKDALPLIAKHKEVKEELKEYAWVVLLPEDFSENRQKFISELSYAEKEKASALAAIKSYKHDMHQLEIYDELINHGDMVEEIYQELGSRRKASKDRLGLETRCSTLRREAREILLNLRGDLSLEEAEKLRIRKTETVMIRELGSQYERILTRMETAKDKLPEIYSQISKINEELDNLDSPLPVDELQMALTDAEEYGPLERLNRNERLEIKNLFSSLASEIQRLGLKSIPFDQLISLPVPLIETIRSFESRFDAIGKELEKIDSEWEKTRQTIKDSHRQIETLRLEQEVPTEQDLENAREKRNRGWGIIANILNKDPVSDEEIGAYLNSSGHDALVRAFEDDVKETDAISDRLRREADKVTHKARLTADLKGHEEQLEQLAKDFQTARENKKELSVKWNEAWRLTGIQPKSPREMENWVQSFDQVNKNLEENRLRQAKIDRLQGEIEACRKKLIHCFSSFTGLPDLSEETLAALIKRAQSVIKKHTGLFEKREELCREKAAKQKEHDLAALKLADNQKELEKWQDKWEKAVRPLGLESKSVPSQATVVIEELKNLFDKLKEAKILQQRIDGIDRDAEDFVRKVSGLVGVIAKDLAGQNPDEAALELHNRLKRSRDAWSRSKTLLKQVNQEEKRLKTAGDKILEIEIHLNKMCRQANCEIDTLGQAEKQSDRRRKLEADLQNLNEQLRKLSGGASVDDFINEVSAIDPDSLDGRLDSLSDQIDELNREKSMLDQTIGSERTELGKMDGSPEAAKLAEEMQNILGRLGDDVDQYARLVMADKILSQSIERFRDKHQGSLLMKASTIFRDITINSFEGIRAEFEENNQPVIVGLRPGGKDIVKVEGMSDGTADQLFLSLRMASVSEYVEKNEPIPFIIDDILIKFDDQRAAATLKQLAKLSNKTQVIYFTHNRHIMDLAAKNLSPSVLCLHTLTSIAQ